MVEQPDEAIVAATPSEMAFEHEGDSEALGGGVEDQLAGIEMVDRRRLQIGQADRIAPISEGVGHVAMEEDGGAGELRRVA